MFTGTEKVLRILLGEKRSLQNGIYSWIQFLQKAYVYKQTEIQPGATLPT